jgi:hypothetical protein
LVISTLIFHHLPDPVKVSALREVRRALAPHGRFLLVDFGAPPTRAAAGVLLAIGCLFDGRDNMRANLLTLSSRRRTPGGESRAVAICRPTNVPCRPWSSCTLLAAERTGSVLTVPTAVPERATTGAAKSSMTLSSSTHTVWPVSAQTLGGLDLSRPRTGSGSGRGI